MIAYLELRSLQRVLILINMDIMVITLDLMYVFFAVDYSFSMHVYNRKKNILFPREGPTDGLDDNATTV